jgi:hypothetical protein
MAIKKSDRYSSLWASCDELRGGMDASQYKDYVLFMLFIKYISDKYGNSDDFAPPVVIPKGASFTDMVALKGKTDIGDKINTQVIQPLIDANSRLARSDFPDFNDPNKLGEGSAMVERLSNLVGIFQKPELDFSDNRAENDDTLGDAYEYLMRHFATESGKSKGQFYTPSEVSRVIAKVLGIGPHNAKAATTRERKAGAVDKDWELIGSVFHRWVRDHSAQLGLGKAQANQKLMAESFPFFAKAYRRVLHASKHYTPGLQSVFYNGHNDFTWQSTVLLAPLVETDDDETVRRKLALTAKPFDQKRAHYAKQNFYAASLDASVYQHQPQFQQFAAAHALPFKPFGTFTKTEQSARRDLVAALVELVWSPQRLQEAAT